jgi:hypothetical protein
MTTEPSPIYQTKMSTNIHKINIISLDIKLNYKN